MNTSTTGWCALVAILVGVGACAGDNDGKERTDTQGDTEVRDGTETADSATEPSGTGDPDTAGDSGVSQGQYPAGSSVARNGHLAVQGVHLVNEHGDPVQLRGLSSYGLQWKADLINDAMLDMIAGWGADIVRLAMYTEQGGYADANADKRAALRTMIDDKIRMIGERGMYALVDWHVLAYGSASGDPWHDIDAAREFFDYMAATHADKAHVLYEIVNEPSPETVKWVQEGKNNDIKEYAEEIIPIIRAHETIKSVVVVGTPVWSTAPQQVLGAPLDFENIVYAKHFYAGSHTDVAQTAALADKLPLFVSEWGVSNYTGDGGDDFKNADAWLDMLKEKKISWCNWSISDIGESTSLLRTDAPARGPYDAHLSLSGEYVKHRLTTDGEPFVVPVDYTLPDPIVISSAGSTVEVSPKKTVYAEGDTVTLTANPAAGEAFDHYRISLVPGDISFTDPTTELTFGADTTYQITWVVAWFRPEDVLLLNGDFSQTDWSNSPHPWTGGAVNNGVLEVDLSVDTVVEQTTSPNNPIRAGDYQLRFDGAGDAARTIAVQVIQGTTTVLDHAVDLGTTMTSHTVPVTIPNDGSITIRFELGTGPGTVSLDNIALTAV